MEVADSLPPKPMQVVDTLDDLDDILSTADNLAEALDISPKRPDEPFKTNGEHSEEDHIQNSENEILENGDIITLSEDEEDEHYQNGAGGYDNKKSEVECPVPCDSETARPNACSVGANEESKSLAAAQDSKKSVPDQDATAENGNSETHVIAESEEEETEPAKPPKQVSEVNTTVVALNGDISKGVDVQSDKEDSDIEIISDEVEDPRKEEIRFDEPELEPPESAVRSTGKDNEPSQSKCELRLEETKIEGSPSLIKGVEKEEQETREEKMDKVELSVVKEAGEKTEKESDTKSDPEWDAAISIEVEPTEGCEEKGVDSPDSEDNGAHAEEQSPDIGDSIDKVKKAKLEPAADIEENECGGVGVENKHAVSEAVSQEENSKDGVEGNKSEFVDSEIIDLDEDSDADVPVKPDKEKMNQTKPEELELVKVINSEELRHEPREPDQESQEDEFLMEIKSPVMAAADEETNDQDRNDESMEIEAEPSSHETSNIDENMDIDECEVSEKYQSRVIELSDDESNDDDQPQAKRLAKESTDERPYYSPQPGTSKDFLFYEDSGQSDSENEEKYEATISTSEDEDCVYYDKECVNCECQHSSKKYYKSPLFILNFFKIQRKTNKNQFVCDTCYDLALTKYEILMKALLDGKPLIGQEIPKRQDFVEILDSSDEEEDEGEEKNKDEKHLRPDVVKMLQFELEDSIERVLKQVDAKQQVKWAKTALEGRLQKMEANCEEISRELKQLQESADKMHKRLYECPKIKIKELPPLDLNTGRQFSSDADLTLPPFGELKRPPIDVHGTYFAVRNKAIASWLPCKVIEAMDVVISGQKSVKYYKVKYLRLKVPTVKCVSAKHMAFGEAPSVRLSIGTRVIALFDGSTLSKNNKETIAPSAFYPGIVAEQLQLYNKYRYLIFFDDGYAQYVHHKDVRVVCQAAENVWEDVHPASREFIHNYLSQYQKHRPMVQVKKGQSMITESNGKWLYAKVVDVDASLVQMQFDGQNRYEWIYRGSTRLGPLFKEKQANGLPKAPLAIQRRSEPYVRYDEDTTRNENNQSQNRTPEKQQTRAVAKKSTAPQQRPDSQQTTSNAPAVRHLNNSTIFLEDDNRPKGKVVYYTAKKNLPPKHFVPHECKPSCLFTITHNLHSYSPLAKPLLSGWERQIFKSKLKKSVVYRAPCGRRLRNMEELHRYLRLTKNSLNVDNFDFDCAVHCLAEYVIESSIVSKADLSNGVENMVIPCVNYYDNTMPPYCEYSLDRIPTEGVKLNLDPNFLVGCDCDDDCSDKSKCSCWQLTLSGARFGNPNTPPENVGYCFKRLLDPVPTGIYECNANCKCKKECLNRVVQTPLQVKLQVFKTSNRGWGLRCLNDIPKGTFICIYAGHLLTEQKANEGGVNASDEYFAELDYIEVVERLKEGYESDVQEENESDDEDIEEPNPDADSDEDFRSKCNVNNKDASINTRLRTRRGTTDDDKSKKSGPEGVEESQERQVINFEPNTSLSNEEQANSNTKYKSIRRYFGKNEFCYIMDAKKTGNIGRYFNHSCSPNLFVQNVFVDTQDLRFPWVAFFALSHIRAGTELTWNYNYEVGIVPGKVLYCECGAPNCRGRLL